MKLFRALSVVVIGSGALWMGCAEEAADLDSNDAPALDAPSRIPLGGPAGSTGTNNLPPPDVHENKLTLHTSTQAAFGTYSASDARWDIASTTSNNALVGDDGGRTLIKYAVRCALPSTTTVHARLGTTEYAYTGQGLLTTTADWLTAALTNSQAQDLFTCLLAHMNAHGVEVPINLSGPNVSNVDGSDGSFTWEEALWAVKITSPGTVKKKLDFYVWPLDDLLDCANYVEQLTDRVCGTYSGPCGLTVRTDRATACTEDSHTGWSCTDATGTVVLPAIKTRLKETDVEAMYDSCP